MHCFFLGIPDTIDLRRDRFPLVFWPLASMLGVYLPRFEGGCECRGPHGQVGSQTNISQLPLQVNYIHQAFIK